MLSFFLPVLVDDGSANLLLAGNLEKVSLKPRPCIEAACGGICIKFEAHAGEAINRFIQISAFQSD